MTDAHRTSAQRLTGFVRRIEHKEAEIKFLRGDISEIYREAKAAGFEPSHMRKIVAARKVPAHLREEMSSTQAVYLNAVETTERALQSANPSPPPEEHHEPGPPEQPATN